MSLEQNVLKPIESNETYDRNKFVKSYGKVSDIGEYLQTLEKDPYNDSATIDLGGTLTGNPRFYLDREKFPSVTHIRGHGKKAYSSCLDNLAKYVETNINDFLNLLKDNSLIGLIHSVPLYKTGKNEHDEFVDAIREMREIEKISKDPEKRVEYVSKKLEKMPGWFKEATYIFSGDRRALSSLFDDMSSSVRKGYERALIDEKGKVRITKMREIIKDSLKEAREHYEKEFDEGTKNDIWESDIRPYYMALAGEVYPTEKNKDKKISNPAKEERKEERRKIGMSQ